MLSMPFFWFIATLLIGFLNLFFNNLLYLGIALACLAAGLVSLFLDIVYLQLTIFCICAATAVVMYYWLSYSRVDEDITSQKLGHVIGREVTVHFWRNGETRVQLNGKVWDACYVEGKQEKLTPGRYKVWKLIADKLILM